MWYMLVQCSFISNVRRGVRCDKVRVTQGTESRGLGGRGWAIGRHLVEKNVGRLHVAVDDGVGVEVREAAEDANHVPRHRGLPQRAKLLHHRGPGTRRPGPVEMAGGLGEAAGG